MSRGHTHSKEKSIVETQTMGLVMTKPTRDHDAVRSIMRKHENHTDAMAYQQGKNYNVDCNVHVHTCAEQLHIAGLKI